MSTPSIQQETELEEQNINNEVQNNNEKLGEPGNDEICSNNEEPENLFLQHGQAYSSLEAFKYITDQYAEMNGFKVIFYKGNNRSDGIRYTQVFTCDRYGEFKPKPKDPKKKGRNTSSKKCNCPWFIRLNYNSEDEKYYISQSVLHHNHPLIPAQLMRILPSNREIPADIREEIVLAKKAGISTSQIQSLLVVKYGPTTKKWIIKDVYNLISTDHILRNEFQAHDFLFLLQQKRNEDPEFSYEFELDCENRLKHVIWTYPSQKRKYVRFHDTIVYDNTYKCNYFSMPFGVFTGVTNNGLSYCVAGALLRDETRSSFEWLFKSFLRIFVVAPQTILTDNDLAMTDAIRSVLTNNYGTKHGLCIWHMLKNIKSNMTSKLGFNYTAFHSDLIKCLNHYIDKDQFEEQWNSVMRNDNYAEAKSYLDVLNQWRERWAPAYLKEFFFADMSSTQRGESMNRLLKSFVDSKTTLTEFLAAFERALDRREEAEHIAAYKELVYLIRQNFQNPIENKAASCLTQYAWKKFLIEWSAKDAYACEETTNNDEKRQFKLSRYERPDIFRWVYYDGRILSCCCRNLEFAGIICRHSLAVAVRLSLDRLDPIHFPKRWQKDPPELELAKDYVNFYSSQPQTTVTPTSDESSSEGASRIRYARINRLCGEIANKIATDPNKCSDFMLYLEKYLEDLYAISSDTSISTCMIQSSASSKNPTIINPIKSKAVGRPKKGRIRCEKENIFEVVVKKKRGRPKKNPEESPTRVQSENSSQRLLQKRIRSNI